MATWQVINNKLTHDDLPEPLTGSYIQLPYPPFWWYANDGKLIHDGLPEPISTIMSEPYPPFIWYVVDDDFGKRLYHYGLPDPIVLGPEYHFIYNGHDIKRVIYNGADIANVIYPSE